MTSVENLPASMIELAETLGLRIALSLIQNFGGQDVKWPKVPKPDHPVVKALGEVDALAVCGYLGGGAIYIPHARRSVISATKIAELEATGLDRAAIGRILGVSTRHLRRVVNRPIDPRQSTMRFLD